MLEEQAKEFIKRLPNLSTRPPTAHLLMLAARSRLMREITGTKIQDIVVERKVVRSRTDRYAWQDKYFRDVWNLDALQNHGSYDHIKESRGSITIPPVAMGIFATIIPRSVARANIELSNYVLTNMCDGLTSDAGLDNLGKIPNKFFAFLHANKHKIDGGLRVKTIDIENTEVYRPIMDELSPFPKWMVTRTSRGYHAIMDITKPQVAQDLLSGGGAWERIQKKWSKDQVELMGDSQEPVPGTLYMNPKKLDTPNYVTIVE